MLTHGDCLCLSVQGLITHAFEWPKPIVSDWPRVSRVFMQPLPLSLFHYRWKLLHCHVGFGCRGAAFGVISITVFHCDVADFISWLWGLYITGNVLHVSASRSTFSPYLHVSSDFYLPFFFSTALLLKNSILCSLWPFLTPARFASHFIK